MSLHHVEHHVANKEHDCMFGDKIHKGQKYVKETFLPGYQFPVDMTELGPVYETITKVEHNKYHAACYNRIHLDIAEAQKHSYETYGDQFTKESFG